MTYSCGLKLFPEVNIRGQLKFVYSQVKQIVIRSTHKLKWLGLIRDYLSNIAFQKVLYPTQ